MPEYVAYAHLLLGKSLVWQGELVSAEAHLREAAAPRRLPPGVVVDHAGVLARANLSMVLALRDQLSEAQTEAVAALNASARAGSADDVQVTSAHVALVLVHLQRADLEQAGPALVRAASVLDRKPDQLLDIARRLAGARLHADAGALDAAHAELGEVAELLEKLPAIPFLAAWLELVQAEVHLAEGRYDAVLGVLDPAKQRPDAASPYSRVLMARALLGLGRLKEAGDLVAPRAANTGVRAVEAWIITAEVESRQRRDGAALTAIGRALDHAAPEQFRRPFIVAGSRLRPLLERYVSLGGAQAELVTSLLPADGPPEGADAMEALTDRELAVLLLLPTMMSNAQIAAELFVSVNTVKAHLKSLYRKLGATNRRDAVLRGQHLTSFVGEAGRPALGP